MNRAVILTAIPVEYIAVKAHLSNLQEEEHEQGTVYELGQFSDNGKSWEVGIVEIGPGNTRAAMETERAIAYFDPDVVLFVGVAGGIKDVKLGDVVAATKVYGYESGKITLEFEPRPDVGEASYKLIQRARAEAKKSDWLERLTSVDSTVDSPRVLVAPIAAGEKVVASKNSSTFKLLQKNYGDAVAVEMEGSGLLQAAHANHQVSALIIRGISDLIDSKSEADAAGWQEIAAQNASAFAFEILAKLTIPIAPGRKKKLNSPTNIANRGTPYFVGRDDQLEQLHQELQQTDRLAICAIAGMGGVGKTELALQYALSYQDNYPGGRCWFPVRGLDLGNQIVSFGRTELGLTIPDELEFNEQVRYCWRHWPEGTVLIVLDDVASFSNDYQQTIKPYLPPAESRFKVLVTSRQRPGASYRRIDLDVLSPEAALELLRKLVGKERIEKELTEAEALCKWLGYLPLGLELVGRYLDLHPTLTIAKVQKRLEKKKLAAKALLDPTEEGEMTAQLGVAAAFELSWEDLKDCPEAQQLGCRLSLFAQAPFEWSLVEKCVIETEDEDDWEEAQEDLEELRDRVAWPTANRSLINRNLLQLTEQQTYQLHPLIREFFLTKLAQLPEADSYKESFCQTIVAVAKEISYTPTRDQISAVSPAIPHLAEVATVLTDWLRDEDLIEPFTGLGRFSEGQGTYDQAEPWYEKCLEITRSRLGEEHRDVATSLTYLANLYQAQGRYHEAEPLFVQALDMYKQLLGEDHYDVASSLNNLANLYKAQGRYHEAEPLFFQALEIAEQKLGSNNPNTINCRNNLESLRYNLSQ
ncbi:MULTISPECIES: tetratricopeptide repeat protein [unclassified Moorena]|uniref:tetratricopeptide repeat protein n=1 Tax=unclassified Moorena TaxID=2683338 RepID=UPI0025DAC3A1|nr:MULTISPECIES: tetratricopeptide repeat protein [unclassified Moorena]